MNAKLKAACERAVEGFNEHLKQLYGLPISPMTKGSCVAVMMCEFSPLLAEMQNRLKATESIAMNALERFKLMELELSKERTAREAAEKACAALESGQIIQFEGCPHAAIDLEMRDAALSSWSGQSYIHKSELEAVEARVNELLAQREDAMEQSQSDEMALNALQVKLQETEKACAEMRADQKALAPYVSHRPQCAIYDFPKCSKPCDCGLQKLLIIEGNHTAGQDFIHRSELERVQKAARELKDLETIFDVPVRKYLMTQFPVTQGHIPLGVWLDRFEKALQSAKEAV